MSEHVGDSLTYMIIDDQTKRLVHRSVVRPFGRNRRVKWDPDLDMTNRNTAQHGGEVMPPAEVRESLLSQACDFFDNAEQDPEAHPICVMNMVKDKTPVTNPSLTGISPKIVI